MNTMTVKDALNLSRGMTEVRFVIDDSSHFITLLSDKKDKLKHCVNRVLFVRAVSYKLIIFAEGTPEFESDNIEEKVDMKDKIALIALAQKFTVDFSDDQWEVKHKTSNLYAIIHNKDINYFVTGTFGSISDRQFLDMNCLMELKEFCEMLVKD